uniref:Nuclease harbi1 n=1 Tax=Triatoma infestans TaxID=30076 RepID=A0A161MBI5_TRIIF
MRMLIMSRSHNTWLVKRVFLCDHTYVAFPKKGVE